MAITGDMELQEITVIFLSLKLLISLTIKILCVKLFEVTFTH